MSQKIVGRLDIHIGLCDGRHTIRTNENEDMDYFVFDGFVELPCATDVHEKVCRDFIRNHVVQYDWGTQAQPLRFNLYITGLTPLLTSFLKCWVEQQERLEMWAIDLVLWHYDTMDAEYVPQKWVVMR